MLFQCEGADSGTLLCDERVHRAVLKDLMAVAVAAQKLSFEIPRGVLLSDVKFTPVNGLMTASNKLCRHALTKRFQEQLVRGMLSYFSHTNYKRRELSNIHVRSNS